MLTLRTMIHEARLSKKDVLSLLSNGSRKIRMAALLLLLLLLDQLVDCWISWSIAFPAHGRNPALGVERRQSQGYAVVDLGAVAIS